MPSSPRAPRSTLALLVLIFGLTNRKALKQSVYIKNSQERVKDKRVSPPYRPYSQGTPCEDMLVIVLGFCRLCS